MWRRLATFTLGNGAPPFVNTSTICSGRESRLVHWSPVWQSGFRMFLRCELLPGARSGYLSTYMPCHQMRSETNSERPRPASYIGSQAKRFEHFETPAKPPFTLSRERRQNTHSRQSLLGAVTVDLWSHRQCLVSDGFETKLGRTDKVIPIQTGKLAIHTLGQKYALAVARN